MRFLDKVKYMWKNDRFLLIVLVVISIFVIAGILEIFFVFSQLFQS